MEPSREHEPLLASAGSNSNYLSESIEFPIQAPRIQRQGYRRRFHLLPGILILILVLIERIAYYALTGNLYLFLHEHKLHWMYYNAISALFIFTGVSYFSSLLGGWLSDAFLGRFKTIACALVLYAGAYWFLTYLTVKPKLCPSMPWINLTSPGFVEERDMPFFEEACSGTVMLILLFAAIGTGVAKANITPFGALQVIHTGPYGLKIYLNWLYWCVNIGALVSILGITYIQQEDGFFSGYAIPSILLSVVTVLFLLSYPLYSHQTASGSSISRIFAVIREAWKSKHSLQGDDSSRNVNQPDWLDMAKARYGGSFHEAAVEDVRSLSTIFKVFILLIPYWMLYFQMQSTFLAQGLQMRLSLQSNNTNATTEIEEKFTIPAAWLMSFNVVFLIIFIPLLNHVIDPYLSKHGIHMSMVVRMVIGMICATASMIIAGCLELCRLYFIHQHKIIHQTIGKTTFEAADLSILWQIPQYSLIGISEVFTSVSGMEFACSQAPSRMQGAVMGLYYFCTGIGSFLGVAAFNIFEGILSIEGILKNAGDINQGRIYYYFFFLALVQFLTVIVFILMSKSIRIRRLPSPSRSTPELVS